ncbi:MAG: CapA family protein [Treponema sp.]|nr:CapA family protein [Treponema sp.]
MAVEKKIERLILRKIMTGLFACILISALPSCTTTGKAPVPEFQIQTEALEEIPVQVDLETLMFQETHFQDGTEIVTSQTAFDGRDCILLTFAGDLMAHPALWRHGEFHRIYQDISDEIRESDLSFVNLETPVFDQRPYSGYPGFNVHREYAEAAIEAGFNVFSLTNNHTNDQGLKGIEATRDFFKEKSEETKGSERPVYHAGLKDRRNGPLTYQYIEVNGWKILYVAITELLNTPSYSYMIDYVPPTSSARNSFVASIKKLREENPSDLFVISIHCCEPEYVFDIKKQQKSWYERLMDAGADVIWVNHPHVAKDWELFPDSDNVPRKMVFYSMGNFISRHEKRNNTGEGFMTQLRFERTDDGIRIVEINPILLTTYRTKDDHYVIRKLDEDFIERLETEDPSQVDFFKERLNFMKKISGKVKWQ